MTGQQLKNSILQMLFRANLFRKTQMTNCVCITGKNKKRERTAGKRRENQEGKEPFLYLPWCR